MNKVNRTVWNERAGREFSSLSSGRVQMNEVNRTCDRHASRLAGASPAMALGRREHVDEGKGARRNGRV